MSTHTGDDELKSTRSISEVRTVFNAKFSARRLQTKVHPEVMEQPLSTQQSLLDECASQSSMPADDSDDEQSLRLFKAIKDGNAKQCRQLLSYKQQLVTKNDIFGNSCLHLAVLHGQTNIVDLCLKKGANAEELNADGMSPLHLAVANNNVDILSSLTRKKEGKVNGHKTHGEKLLHKVGRHYKKDIKDLLQDKWYIKYKGHAKDLIAATENNDLKKVKELMDNHDLSIKNHKKIVSDEDGNSLLHIAAKNGSKDIVKHLLTNDYKCKIKNKKKQLPLHLAAQHGHFEVVKMLLDKDEKKQHVYDSDDSWNTAFHLAASEGHMKVMECLLEVYTIRDDCYPSTLLPFCGAAICCCGCCDKQTDVIDPFFSRNSHGYTPLHLACIKGHSNIVKYLFKRNFDNIKKLVKQRDVKGNSCLHLAVMNNHKKIAKKCLNQGAEADAYNEDGLSPLHLAVMNGYVEIAHILLDKYPNTKEYGDPLLGKSFKKYKKDIIDLAAGKSATKEKNYKEALIFATEIGQCQSLKTLLEHVSQEEDDERNLGKSATDEHGNTLLHIAANVGHIEVVEYMLKKKVDRARVNNYGQTPLHLAAVQGHDDIIKKLLQSDGENSEVRESVNAVDKSKSTALHLAASGGHESCVTSLLEYIEKERLQCNNDDNASKSMSSSLSGHKDNHTVKSMTDFLNITDIQGSTPLLLACAKDNINIVDILINKGSDINRTDIYGNTCLHIAITNKRTEVVARLLKNGGEIINKCNNKKIYPLHLVAANGDLSIATSLLENGADVKVVNLDGATPMHKACEYGHEQIIKILADKSSEILSKFDTKGRTAFILATENGNTNAIKALSLYKPGKVIDSNWNTPLHIATIRKDRKLVNFLLKQGKFNSQCRNKDGQIPLHLAAERGHLGIVEDLVRQEATSVNACDNTLSTPLHLAASAGRCNVVKFLIESGAESKCDESKLTPFERAAESGCNNTIKYFLNAHSPNPRAMKQCLISAAKKNYAEIIQILLKPKYAKNMEKDDIHEGLFTAIESNSVDAVRAIINSDSWMIALEGCRMRTKHEMGYCWKTLTRVIDTPMSKLIVSMPDVAEDVLNKCTKMAPEHTYQLFKEKIIDGIDWPDYKGSSRCMRFINFFNFRKMGKAYKDNHPLMIMVREKRFNLLNHELVAALVKKKWNKLGWWYFWFRLLMYLAFVAVLTGFVEGTYAPYTHTLTCEELASQGYKQGAVARHCRDGIYFFAVLNLACELMERLLSVRASIFEWGNILELITYTFSLLLVWNKNDCQQDTGYRHEWQWNLGTVAILLAWVNLVLNSQDHPKLGVYGVLVERLTKVFTKFLLVFMMFIIGFALTFRANLQNQIDFRNFWVAMVKTTAMMIGEFTFDDLYTNGEVHYRIMGHIIFFLFMIWMSIFIMNLMIGLAVDHISDVEKQSDNIRKTIEVELVLDIEKNICRCFLNWLYKTKQHLEPDPKHHRTWVQHICRFLAHLWGHLKGTENAQNDNDDEFEDESQKKEFKEIKNTLATLEQIITKNVTNTGNKGQSIRKQKYVKGGNIADTLKTYKADTIILERIVKAHKLNKQKSSK